MAKKKNEANYDGVDEPYFKLAHDLNEVRDYVMPDEFYLTDITESGLCYSIRSSE